MCVAHRFASGVGCQPVVEIDHNYIVVSMMVDWVIHCSSQRLKIVLTKNILSLLMLLVLSAAAAAAAWHSVEFSTSETQCHCGGDRQELLTYLIDLIVSSNSAQRAYQYNSSSLQKSVSGE